jgi:pyridoxal phosphate enzyme (YggS family)
MLANTLQQVHNRIHSACIKAKRQPEEVSLLAVSKYQSIDAIREVVAAGQIDFGENYVQELVQKAKDLVGLKLSWHFIGPLQSNKCKEVAQYADSIHSLDRSKLIKPLAGHRPLHLPPLKVFLQMNIDDEASKSGVKDWDTLVALAKEVNAYPQLLLSGLMTIPAPKTDMTEQRKAFAKLRDYRDKLADTLGQTLPELSMGMSADLESAIYEGATLVRVGTDIFGTRNR